MCAGGSRGCRRASVYLNGEGRDSGSLGPLLPPEPASPSAERSRCTDLLSGVRYLHMTCPFVNLAPQLLASLHLCLPVPRTLQAPARLSATSAACRAPPLASSPLAHPPLSTQGHVGLGGCSALASPSLPLSLRSFLFSSSGCCCCCCYCCYRFSSSWKPRTQAVAPWRSSRTLRVNSLRALPPRLREHAKNSPTCSPLLPGSSAVHRMEVEKEKKNVQTAWMLG